MSPAEAALWLPTLAERPDARVRLLCFPYGGGGASVFRTWHTWADIEVRAVQLPARQDRLAEPGVTSIPAIVESVAEALATLPPLPLAFYGHSFGALVAYELTRRVEGLGQAVGALVVGGRRAPHLPRREPNIRHLADSEFVEALARHYSASFGALLKQNPDLAELAMPSLRADFTAVESYVPAVAAPLAAPVVVLRGLEDPAVTEAEAAAWKQTTAGRFASHTLAAGHFFVDTHGSWVRERVREAVDAMA